jgi:hypothetical protein
MNEDPPFGPSPPSGRTGTSSVRTVGRTSRFRTSDKRQTAHPADAPRHEFTFFGYTFLPTDTLLFMLFLGTVIVTVFLLTALFGRVWCGWACPQTVWMEYLFRPSSAASAGQRVPCDRPQWQPLPPASSAKFVVFFDRARAGHLPAYLWVRQIVPGSSNPREHPSVRVMVFTTTPVFADFAHFRANRTIACPIDAGIGALDKVRYRRAITARRTAAAERSVVRACCRSVDCGMRVPRPTGSTSVMGCRWSDPLHTVHDACDAVMEDRQASRPHSLRPATCRRHGAHLVRPDHRVSDRVRQHVHMLSTNRGGRDVAARRSFLRRCQGASTSRARIANRSQTAPARDRGGGRRGAGHHPVNPFPVARGKTETTSFFVTLPREAFSSGEPTIEVHISDAAGFDDEFEWRLLGPTPVPGDSRYTTLCYSMAMMCKLASFFAPEFGQPVL